MYVAMNRFRIAKGREAEFEDVWRSRDSRLGEVPGFLGFHLLKGPERADHHLYASHIVWQSEQHLLDWTRSEQFRVAHAQASEVRDLYIGHPEFEGFTAVLETVAPARAAA